MVEKLSHKLYNWASILDDQTRAQAIMTAKMPFIFPHMSVMPDAHLGKGATVGSVIPTLGAIIPAAVGVDIGCGMIAVRTQFRKDQLPTDLKPLREAIEKAIPLSAGNYNTAFTTTAIEKINLLEGEAVRARFNPATYAPNWQFQLGTLGSGNHFIEVSLDEEDRVWLFLHSGSRGIGNKIAQHHIKVAQEMAKKWWIDLPDPDLAYLVEGTNEFWEYIRQLQWAQYFAKLNRQEMMDRVTLCFENFLGETVIPEMAVNCHHNYTTQETHYGKKVWLSRKGAIDASEGTLGLVPGSMGTRSYVVEGLGNRLSLNSSPHGAGREYSRTAAKKQFTIEELEASMEGIEWSHSKEFIDEIPGAYKDIDVVMEDAKDLIKVRHTLRQILNVKGD